MQATEEDYEQVPIEQFGLAVLRGMGWKETDGVGRTGKYVKHVDSVSNYAHLWFSLPCFVDFSVYLSICCLQCFDIVGLASGRASDLYKIQW